MDKRTLRKRYCTDKAHVSDIATEAGCSIHNIRRLLKKYGLKRGRKHLRPWNEGLTKEDAPILSTCKMGEKNGQFGKKAWNSGRKCPEISKALKGKKKSRKHRDALAAAKRGKKGKLSNRWKGGIKRAGKYLMVGETKQYVHRAIAEQHYGKKLAGWMQVHHIDVDTLNNRPTNLMILNNRTHAALHQAMRRTKGLNQKDWLRRNKKWFVEILNEGCKEHKAGRKGAVKKRG